MDDLITNVVCGCSVCGKDILKGEPMADYKVFKFGELDEIDLAHKACAVADNAANPARGWKWEYD